MNEKPVTIFRPAEAQRCFTNQLNTRVKEAEMLKCKYCPRQFDNLQARRGHYRACPMKPRSGQATQSRLNRQEPGIGFEIEPGSARSSRAEIDLPSRSPLTPNYILGMIEAMTVGHTA